MSLRFEDIVDSQSLTNIVQERTNGVPEDILPSEFFSITEDIMGDRGMYGRTTGTSGMAPITGYNTASGLEQMSGVDVIPYECLNVRRHFVIDNSDVARLKNTSDQTAQRVTLSRVTNSIERITSRMRGSLVGSIFSMLQGSLRYDADGNILKPNPTVPSDIEHDFNIPAGHKSQLDVFGDGAIIGTKWSTTTSTPITDIADIKAAARKETGLPISTAMYGSNIHGFLLLNTALQQTINGNPNFSSSFAGGTIPQGFLGIQRWIPFNEAFAEAHTSTDTSRSFIDFHGANDIIFMPTVSREWYTLYRGSYEVPSSLGIDGDAFAAMNRANTVFGPFSYATTTQDPFGVKVVLGNTWFPALTNPKAIYKATVEF